MLAHHIKNAIHKAAVSYKKRHAKSKGEDRDYDESTEQHEGDLTAGMRKKHTSKIKGGMDSRMEESAKGNKGTVIGVTRKIKAPTKGEDEEYESAYEDKEQHEKRGRSVGKARKY
jgi:hypothetical protein